MNKEEILKIQTCVLKVNIHCDGCQQKVKKILQKIDGVFTTKIDSEQGKVTVSGTVDPQLLVRKLAKAGKHAELWGSQQKQLKNQVHNDPKSNNAKAPKGHGNNTHNIPPKKSGQHPQPLPQSHPQQLPFTQQQLKQLQQMKGFQDLKLPAQFKDLNMMGGFKDPNQHKAVKFGLSPDEDDMISDDESGDDDFDDDDYDFTDDDEVYEDPMDDIHGHHHGGVNANKMMMMKPAGGGPNGPNAMLNALMNGGSYPQLVKGGSGEGNNTKKGGNGAPPVHIGGGDGKNGSNGMKKGNNQGQGGGVKNNGGKKGGGGDGLVASNAKNGQHVGGKKGGGAGGNAGGHHLMEKGFQGRGGGSGGGFPIGQMSGGMPTSQGLTNGGARQGYFQAQGNGGASAGMDTSPGGNPHLQQQYLAAMMNQRAAAMAAGGGGDPRFQPMMYSRPAPAVNYMPQYPYPYPYPYPPPHSDPYTDVFSDENTSSCSIM